MTWCVAWRLSMLRVLGLSGVSAEMADPGSLQHP
jgi:hypothetical protein